MYILMVILAVLASIVSLVCFIMVLVKIFKDSVGLGILGILIPLFVYIYGWIKSSEYSIKKTMLMWTAAIVAGVIFQMGAVAFMAKGAVNSSQELQRQLLQQQQQFKQR